MLELIKYLLPSIITIIVAWIGFSRWKIEYVLRQKYNIAAKLSSAVEQIIIYLNESRRPLINACEPYRTYSYIIKSRDDINKLYGDNKLYKDNKLHELYTKVVNERLNMLIEKSILLENAKSEAKFIFRHNKELISNIENLFKLLIKYSVFINQYYKDLIVDNKFKTTLEENVMLYDTDVMLYDTKESPFSIEIKQTHDNIDKEISTEIGDFLKYFKKTSLFEKLFKS